MTLIVPLLLMFLIVYPVLLEEELGLRKKRLSLEKLRADGTRGCSPQRLIRDPTLLFSSERKSEASQSLEAELGRLALEFSLPKIEIEPFHGRPIQCASFMTTFNSQIETNVTSPRQKLAYLMYYCRGQAKEAIKHCDLLPEDRCFAEAVEPWMHCSRRCEAVALYLRS